MKANAQTDFYTDPILYEEGFFKDRQAEVKFLEKVAKTNQKQAKSLKTKRK